MNRVKLFLGGIFLPLGLIFAAIGLWSYVDGRDLAESGIRTQASVVEMARSRDSDGDITYRPVVTFADRDGNFQRFVDSVSSSPPRHYVGEKVPVIYDPKNPARATIDGFLERSLFSLVFGGVGALFALTGAGLLASWWLRKRTIARLRATGVPIEAQFLECFRDTSTRLNNRNPWRVACQAVHPATGKLQRFESETLWVDPSETIAGKPLRVWIDRQDPGAYFVDLSDQVESGSIG